MYKIVFVIRLIPRRIATKGIISSSECFAMFRCLSKIFEGVIVDQLSEYCERYFSKSISGFRKGHDSQGVIIRFSESIKSHLDNNNVTAAVLIDLSKAFDCLPYDLLLSKFYL